MFEAIANAPVPTLLIVAGLFFILIGIGASFGAMFNTSNMNRGLSGIFGICLLVGGLMLWGMKQESSTSTSLPQRTLPPGSTAESTRSPPKIIPMQPAGMGPYEINTDRWGDDLKAIELSQPSAASCSRSCAREPTCKSFTYRRPNVVTDAPAPVCFLKFGPGIPKSDNCCTSGEKR